LREALEELYLDYNRREYVHPDPLEFLYKYRGVRDREVVGLVASSLAYGRVAQILKSVQQVLDVLGRHPADFIAAASRKDLERALCGFKHRFTTGEDVAGLLIGANRAIEKHGSLNKCFVAGLSPEDDTVVHALDRFAVEITGPGGCTCDFLLPSSRKGSACKRLNLYLRWMVRRDDVDPGGWKGVSPAMLVVPLDTHMHQTALAIGLTSRKQANLRTAIEITAGFREVAPADPVRYDFSLTRLGIRGETSLEEFMSHLDER
jgi:uncharacterized protein (TIGR02757 family)